MRKKRRVSGLVLGALSWLVAEQAAAQAEVEEPFAGSIAAALDECGAAGREKAEGRMSAAAARLEAVAAALEAQRPADALVVRAQVLSRCRIPFTSVLRAGALIEESNELLGRALEMEPEHLGARFALAMNHYHTPAFLGRTGAAIHELERLLEVHGDRLEPTVAMAYLYLGNLHEREGRLERAEEVWRRGAERFPEFAPLGGKAATGGAPAAGAPTAVDTAQGPPLGPHTRAGVAAPRGAPADTPATAEYELPPLVVEVSTYSVDDPRAATRLSKVDVYTMPGGTADIFQVFQTLPGVTRVTEGSELYVRGGDPAETPIYVDGTRLFYPGRFETLNGSIFGVLDPSVMRTAYFSSGGFSARYGNALSGVVALETEARPEGRRWRAGANLTSLGGTAWRRLGERGGMWSTGMLTHTRPLLEVHGRTDDYPESPRSAQAMVGFTHEPLPGLELRATALAESDHATARVSAAGHDGPFRSRAATRLAGAAVRVATPDGGAVARLSLGASVRESALEFGVIERDRTDRSAGARLDGQLARTWLSLRSGLEVARLGATTAGSVPAGEEVAPGSPSVTADREEGADHLGGYAELEVRVARRLALVAGLRADRLPGEDGWTEDTRLAAAYQRDRWTVRFGAGDFSQGRWRTRYALPDEGSPAGIPRRARHLVVGIQHDGAPALRVEAYVKRYDDFVADAGAAEAAPRVVAGRAAGLDLLVRPQAVGSLAGWLTYSYLSGEVELEDGARVPAPHDVTHTLTAVAKLAVGVWELGLTGRYATGRPRTPILGAAPPTAERRLAPLYGPIHSERMPRYSRLDGRVTRVVPLWGGMLATYLEGLNLLDRGNVMAYTYDSTYQNPRPVRTFFSRRTLVLGVEAQF